MHRALRTLTLGGVLAVAVPIASLSAQATDPAIGTWRLNLAKSKLDPGPPPRRLTVTYELAGPEVTITAKGVDAQGEPIDLHFTARYDGKDYPVIGSPDYDTTALKRINAFRAQGVRRKSGTVVQTFTRVIAKDGKSYTLTTKGTNGQTIHDVAVYDKQ